MPTVSRWFIKTGLFFFCAALLVAGFRWLTLVGVSVGPLAAAGAAQFHLFVFGWITQIIIGVAIWLFPPLSRENPRGRIWLAWSSYATINVGLLLRAVAEPVLGSGTAGAPWSWLLVISALLQTAGGLAFVIDIWPRVKGRGD